MYIFWCLVYSFVLFCTVYRLLWLDTSGHCLTGNKCKIFSPIPRQHPIINTCMMNLVLPQLTTHAI